MLSKSHLKALSFIREFIVHEGYAPTLSEIALGIGIRSKGVVHRYVQALAQEGVIELHAGRKRGITLPEPNKERDMTLPLAGRIAAGRPIEAIEDQVRVDLAAFFIGPGRFALQVCGDSMEEAGILDGDMVVVAQQEHAADGDIVVALIDNEEATLKYLRRNPQGDISLIPANSAMVPMVYAAERVRIQGVVVGQLRTYGKR
ncbi:MAG: hypothetical protein DIZ77_10530 [endosymbiont of Seepiophila jonesi]|uniref:LexA repressor n=1 Tax=endosymbiont of Lamellibrachia luymesi TaxID=2200907 RepID=A0A370DZ42_9GAMM|nr:MAG: hypothetical protein DIZ77_10530 [endosymbiont of Seepiophila jonesi]RDH91774.1 MAG: hypothetical protein DIZ79_05185 [endosymbiont of Lamellibrachia luymesi]